MLAKRIIPCLDCDLSVPSGRVVKGVKFKKIRYAGIPWELAEKYYREGADEIVFLDITASHEKRETMTNVIEKTVENVFVPITIGGGINSLESARKVFNAGADKVSINTAAIKNPDLINEISNHFGSQACVLAIDCKRNYSDSGKYFFFDDSEKKGKGEKFWYECYIYGGRTETGLDAIAWALEGEKRGAGEILLTSMDRDGTKEGYDLLLTREISERIPIPVIASGGAGNIKHLEEALTLGKADAALLAGLLHFGELTIPEIKKELKGKVAIRS